MYAASLALLTSLQAQYAIQAADTPALVQEAQQLRYQVFVRERGVIRAPAQQSVERDEFDGWSHHILLRRRDTQHAVGTARLVTFNPDRPACFPIQRVCNAEQLRGIPFETTGEISRFGLSRAGRGVGDARVDSLLMLKLVQGVLQRSLELGLTHWCAIMERSLLRLLRSIGIHFEPVGPMVEFYGLRQPAVTEIAPLLFEGRRRCPLFHDFLLLNRTPPAETVPMRLAA